MKKVVACQCSRNATVEQNCEKTRHGIFFSLGGSYRVKNFSQKLTKEENFFWQQLWHSGRAHTT